MDTSHGLSSTQDQLDHSVHLVHQALVADTQYYDISDQLLISKPGILFALFIV